MDTVKLYNVIDTRTNQFHSVAIVKERNARWFVPANEAEQIVEEPVQAEPEFVEPVIVNYEEADEADD